jgi:uncharacterized protein YabE (DUF348 family)
MKLSSDDVVVTREGVEHRVIYQSGDQVFARPTVGKNRKPRMISVASIKEHKPKGK